jgi:HEAT repeat protein
MNIRIHPSTKPARIALVNIGKPAVSPLIKFLAKAEDSKDDESIGWIAIMTLSETGPVAVPKLIKALSDPNPSIRDGSALALAYMHGAEAKATKAIKRALKTETDPSVRASLEYALRMVDRGQ